MKKVITIRIYLLVLLLAAATAAESSTYYSKAIAKVATASTGRGKVYVTDPDGSSSEASENSQKTYSKYESKDHTYSFKVSETTPGYEFDGWYENETGGSKIMDGLSGTTLSYKITSTQTSSSGEPTTKTLYARWNFKLYTINLDDDGADNTSVSPSSITVHYNNDDYSSAITLPVKDGFAFQGFWTGAGGTGTKVIDGNGNVLANVTDATYTYTEDGNWKYSATDAITLYAKWGDKELPEETSTPASRYYVGDVVDLAECWTTESDATPAYSIVPGSFKKDDGNHDGCPSDPTMGADKHTVTFSKAGTLTLRMVVAPGTNHLGTTIDKGITIVRNDPKFTWNGAGTTYYHNTKIYDVFSSENTASAYRFSSEPSASAIAKQGTGNVDTLIIYNVAETATITVEQDANYYWNRKVQTFDVTPVNPINHVPFTYSGAMYDDNTITITKNNSAFWWTTDTPYHLACGPSNGSQGSKDDKYIVIHFQGIPDKLNFKHRTNHDGATADWYIQESADGTFGETNVWSSTSGSKKEQVVSNIQLQSTTRYLRIGYRGEYIGRYFDIQVTELETFDADLEGDVLDFGTKGAKYGEQVKTFVFNHVNAGRITTAEILSGSDAACFSVTPSTISGTGRDMYGFSTLAVSFDNNDEVGKATDYTATLRISDANGHQEDVTLKGHREGKTEPEFTWNPHHMPYYCSTSLSNFIVSTNTDYEHAPLSFESSDESIAEVIDGVLHIYNKKEKVTITVSQDEYGDYSSHEESFDFTPRDVPTLVAPYFVTKSIFDSDIADGESSATWDSESANDIRLGDGWVFPTSWGAKSFTIAFTGTPDSLTFRYKTSSSSTSSGWGDGSVLTAPKWKIEESSNGADWTTVWNVKSNSESWRSVTVALSSSTRYLCFTYDGNGYGYYGDIQLTAFDGCKYLKTSDGKYLSRGGKWGTQAIVDEFGVPVRITRYTKDNINDTTLVKFLDNNKYLFEEDNEESGANFGKLFTDIGVGTKSKWIQTTADGKITLRRAIADGKYITLDEDALAMGAIGVATSWTLESASDHDSDLADAIEADVVTASIAKFGAEVDTKEKMLAKIAKLDYTNYTIAVPHLNTSVNEADEEDRNGAGVDNVYDYTKDELIPGLYRLTVQAFHQTAPDPTDWNNHESGLENVTAYLYANGVKVPLKSRYDEIGSLLAIGAGTSIQKGLYYYPADGAAAHKVFETPTAYVNEIYVYVADAGEGTGTLNYGIEKPSYVPGEWLAYENFQLVRIDQKDYIYTDGIWTLDGNEVSAPTSLLSTVTIQDNVNITTEVKAYSVNIDEDVLVTIKPTGGLTVGAGGIVSLSDEKIKLESNTDGKTGFLRIDPEYAGAMPEADVELYTKAFYNKSEEDDEKRMAKMQYIGVPVDEENYAATDIFTDNTYVYSWSESKSKWVNKKSSLKVEAFTGYSITQFDNESGGEKVDFSGTLLAPTDQDIDLAYSGGTYSGRNFLANSYSAPIDISLFEYGDFSLEKEEDLSVDFAIYMFNTGAKGEYKDAANEPASATAAGQYITVTPGTASTLHDADPNYPIVIPSMQGFFVKTNATGKSLHLDYERLIWKANYSEHGNEKLRAKRRTTEEEQEETEPSNLNGLMKISLYSNVAVDHIYLLESDEYSKSYENGYDGRKMLAGDLNIYAIEGEEALAVDATDDLEGTKIGIRTGSCDENTIAFSKVKDVENLYLYDSYTGISTQIEEGATYDFYADPNSYIDDRFEIVGPSGQQGTATGVGYEKIENKATKYIKDNTLFILKNGIKYNSLGQKVQ